MIFLIFCIFKPEVLKQAVLPYEYHFLNYREYLNQDRVRHPDLEREMIKIIPQYIKFFVQLSGVLNNKNNLKKSKYQINA